MLSRPKTRGRSLPAQSVGPVASFGPDAIDELGKTRLTPGVEPYDEEIASERIIAVENLYYIYQHEKIGVFRGSDRSGYTLVIDPDGANTDRHRAWAKCAANFSGTAGQLVVVLFARGIARIIRHRKSIYQTLQPRLRLKRHTTEQPVNPLGEYRKTTRTLGRPGKREMGSRLNI
jgi:hypothetical protein